MKVVTASGSVRELALLWCAAAASALALRPLWIELAPHLPPCLFRSVTGIPCPTCGTGRAATALLHGDITTAVVLNPLATVLAVAAIVAGLVAPLWVWAGGPVPNLGSTRVRRVVWAGLIVAVVNWGYLIATLP